MSEAEAQNCRRGKTKRVSLLFSRGRSRKEEKDRKGGATYPNLIAPLCLSEVPDPLDRLVVALLKHLEEPDEQTRGGEHDHCIDETIRK